MRVSEAMTRPVRICHSGQSIGDCARIMREADCGALPVAERNRLVGMVTDRDIAVRAVAAGKGPDTAVGEVMSRQVAVLLRRPGSRPYRAQHGRGARAQGARSRSQQQPGRDSVPWRHFPQAEACGGRSGDPAVAGRRAAFAGCPGMNDDLLRGELAPESWIDADSDADLTRWSKRWKVSKEELRRAIQRVGSRAEDVRQHLIGGFSPPGPSS